MATIIDARMAAKPKEEHFVILELSEDYVRAGVGIYDMLRRPTVELKARAGLRTSRDRKRPAQKADYLVGPALDAAERAGEQLDIIWPIVSTDPTDEKGKGKQRSDGVVDWLALEAILSYIVYSALAIPPQPFSYFFAIALPPHLPSVTSERMLQLLFERIDMPAVLFIERPVAAAYACNTADALFVDVGRQGVDVSIVRNNGVVDGGATARCNIGEDDCDAYMTAMLLATQPTLPAALNPGGSPLAGEALKQRMAVVLAYLKDNGYINFASLGLGLNVTGDAQGTRAPDIWDPNGDLDGEGFTDVAAVLASGQLKKLVGKKEKRKKFARFNDPADIVNVPHPLSDGHPPIAIGPERHRYFEPLFDPWVLPRAGYTVEQVSRRAMSISEAVACAVHGLDIEPRAVQWSNLILSSRTSSSRIRGLSSALARSLGSRFLTLSERIRQRETHQPSFNRFIKPPDYLLEFKNRPDLVVFAGASIVAKLAFNDGMGHYFVTKQDYAAGGPSIVTKMERM